MSAKENNHKWSLQARWPHTCYETPAGSWHVNSIEFVVGGRNSLGRYTFYKYNIGSDTWTLILTRLLNNINVSDVEIDWKMKRMFVRAQLNLQREWFVFDIQDGSQIVAKRDEMQIACKMISLNGIIHCVGHSWRGTTHNIWSEGQEKWQPVNARSLPKFRRIDSLVHVPSKNILLIFGGDITNPKCYLWRYHIGSERWEQIKAIQCDGNCAAILTSDERFVIIKSYAYNKTHLFILDIRDDNAYKLRESPISIQSTIPGIFARTGGIKESVATAAGWIRRISKSRSTPSMCIARWYAKESIHWIVRKHGEEPNHQMIALKDILALNL